VIRPTVLFPARDLLGFTFLAGLLIRPYRYSSFLRYSGVGLDRSRAVGESPEAANCQWHCGVLAVALMAVAFRRAALAGLAASLPVTGVCITPMWTEKKT